MIGQDQCLGSPSWETSCEFDAGYPVRLLTLEARHPSPGGSSPPTVLFKAGSWAIHNRGGFEQERLQKFLWSRKAGRISGAGPAWYEGKLL